ncbi:unnamed protein product, partial [Polarella glacialis]
ELSVVTIALTVGDTNVDDSLTASSTASFLYRGRPRAAAVAMVRAARKQGAKGHVAAACARLGIAGQKLELVISQDDKKAAAEQAAAKKLKPSAKKDEEVHNKVRVRQILIRFWSGKGPQPVNPVTRKTVSRKADEAELQMVNALEKLVADGCKSFASVCKANSEC